MLSYPCIFSLSVYLCSLLLRSLPSLDYWLTRLGGSEVLRSLRHYLRAGTKPRTVTTIDRVDLGERRRSVRRSFLKERERTFVNQTSIGTVLKATSEKLPRDWDGAHIDFPERVDTILELSRDWLILDIQHQIDREGHIKAKHESSSHK